VPDTNLDIERLRQVYDHRSMQLADSDSYTFFNITNLFIIHQRERQILKLLKAIHKLAEKQILEVGCGGGGVLLDFLRYGTPPGYLYGIDLLHNRLGSAYQRLSGSHFANADGQNLPFLSGQFDLLLQFTAFSSILDYQIKLNMAGEMLRVMKDDGWILWYDFWWNPTNPQTAGIKPKEIRGLFPGCAFTFRKITLAPPIARRVVPISWPFALFLESLKLVNSHYLVLIKKGLTESS
jgi:ubiquinone/menaquinone biosynthesis C-methylase UbiE